MSNLHRGNRVRRGMMAVEVAIIIPLLLTLILGIMDSARYLMMRQLLDNAAREGARLAAVSTASLSTADIQAAVRSQVNEPMFSALTIQVYKADAATGGNIGAWTSAGLGDCIGVKAAATFVPTTPGFGVLPHSVIVSATCIAYSEAN